eukprot:SAG31_NODE_1676_length_7551_cov_1.951691_2_plen_164_part_00
MSGSFAGGGQVGNYHMIGRLGAGAFGQVFKGQDKNTGEIVAIKIINLEEAEDEIETGKGCYFLVIVQLFEKYGKLIERNTVLIEKVSALIVRQEIAVLAQCQSAYVTKYIESFVNGSDLWIVMEYMAGGSIAGPTSRKNLRALLSSFTAAVFMRRLDRDAHAI